MGIAKGKKKINIAVTAEPYERLREKTKAIGWPSNWLSKELDKMVNALLVVADQAVKDAEEQRKMTDDEAKARYEALTRKLLEK